MTIGDDCSQTSQACGRWSLRNFELYCYRLNREDEVKCEDSDMAMIAAETVAPGSDGGNATAFGVSNLRIPCDPARQAASSVG